MLVSPLSCEWFNPVSPASISGTSTTNTVTLTWPAGTDDYKVGNYLIYRTGTPTPVSLPVGTLTWTDTKLDDELEKVAQYLDRPTNGFKLPLARGAIARTRAAVSVWTSRISVAGAPVPYYIAYVEPTAAFSLNYTVNSIAMPIIGGMTGWPGPVIGAVLLGSIQQLATVTISSSLNLLVVGVLLIVFVSFAPNGIMGLAAGFRTRRQP